MSLSLAASREAARVVSRSPRDLFSRVGGWEVAERGVPPPAVGEDLDVLEHRDARLGLGRPRAAVDEVLLDRGVKALEQGVVEPAALGALIETSIPAARQRRVKIRTCAGWRGRS
jgi:hypothetical protein